MSSDQEIVVKEMQRTCERLDGALAAWVDTLSPLKRQLLASVLADALEKRGFSMWKPETLKLIGLFFWHSRFPRSEFEAMVEAYIVFFATSLRADLIPEPDEDNQS